MEKLTEQLKDSKQAEELTQSILQNKKAFPNFIWKCVFYTLLFWVHGKP